MDNFFNRLNLLYQMACEYKPEGGKELQRLLDKAGRRQRITDAELQYIEAVGKELHT